MGTLSKLRRLVLRDGLSVRQASLRLGISRNTATKWLSEPEMVEPHYPVRQSAASVLDPYKEQLVTWLKADSQRNKRERRGVKALFEALRATSASTALGRFFCTSSSLGRPLYRSCQPQPTASKPLMEKGFFRLLNG